jgi:hypothetical protein
MRGPACPAIVGPMARTSIATALEFEKTFDSPVGTARLPDGTSRTFHGWLGLAEVADAFAAMPTTGGAPATSPPVLPTQAPEVPTT